ncbi:efflux RND transporter periplasmic adaptor subunit [Paenibacillus peoriae]|uniref:efflux RND transporter periplasmic adaptor subunit n=1 Tax=Paenibacillus peoriae TaxID=59893 RepID=UPI00096D22C5|nr:efflux RND transporter periplasmic adaptor subunit [Paenibacillus peoriae]OMF81298.1 efflux transporter periplasmic adaptor subunit [Paenibacillus peoriae]
MKRWEATTAVILLGTIIISGCSQGTEAPQDINVKVKVSQAHKGVIGRGEIYTGKITSSETVNITPKISGKVKNIAVDVGTEVKKGQLLLKLEDDDLRNNLKIAKSNVSAAEAAIMSAEDTRESSMVSANSGIVSSRNSVISSKSAISQAEKGINEAQQTVNQAQTALKQARTAVSTATNTIRPTQEGLLNAKKNLSRTQTLYNSSLVTQAQLEEAQAAQVSAQTAYDNATNAKSNAKDQLSAGEKSLTIAQKALATSKTAYENAKNSYENTNIGYKNAQRQLVVSQSTAGIEASQQKLEQSKLNVDIVHNLLNNSVITSPINGIVKTKNIEVGEITSTSSPSLVIHNLDSVNLLIYVTAEKINDIKVGDPVQVRVASPATLTTGKVKSISSEDTNGNGFPVKITVVNTSDELKSGMLADVSFVGTNAKEGIIISTRAIEKEGNMSYVYVAANGHAIRKEITIGEEAGPQTLITNGLKDGDQVIVNNLALLSNNTAIRISKP